MGLFGSDCLDKFFVPGQGRAVAAFLGSELVAVDRVKLFSSFDYYLPFDPELPVELRVRRVASFDTLSVREDLPGRGVGGRLSQMRLECMRSQGVEVALGVSWVSGKAHTSNRTFEEAGFRAVRRVDHFSARSSLENPFDCPGCHVPPCSCSAVLYRLDLVRS